MCQGSSQWVREWVLREKQENELLNNKDKYNKNNLKMKM